VAALLKEEEVPGERVLELLDVEKEMIKIPTHVS
jgi:hypothetical protein